MPKQKFYGVVDAINQYTIRFHAKVSSRESLETIGKRIKRRHDAFNFRQMIDEEKLEGGKSPLEGEKFYVKYKADTLECLDKSSLEIKFDPASVLGKKAIVWAEPKSFNFVSKMESNDGWRVQGWRLQTTKIQITDDCYDSSLVPPAHGLKNTGVICYLNSFIQSLLSCPAVVKTFLDREAIFEEKKNIVALEFIKLIRQAKTSEGKVLDPTQVFLGVVESARKKNPSINFGARQEDSGEGLTLFLDAIDDKWVYDLFMYQYDALLVCKNCNEVISRNTDKSCVLEIPLTLHGIDETLHPLNSHIKANTSLLEDYKCGKCERTECGRIYILRRVPNILPVMFNKFFRKTNLDFPQHMYFKGHGQPINYRAVAKIEHAGGRGGGHYWAHAYRTQGEGLVPTRLDDSRVSVGTLQPSVQTYIVFYHYDREVPIETKDEKDSKTQPSAVETNNPTPEKSELIDDADSEPVHSDPEPCP